MLCCTCKYYSFDKVILECYSSSVLKVLLIFHSAKKFRLSDASLKDCLYWSIQDGAKKLIYPDFLPDKRQNRAMTAQEYAQKLKEVFLPPGESDAAKIEFERRVQLPGYVLQR